MSFIITILFTQFSTVPSSGALKCRLCSIFLWQTREELPAASGFLSLQAEKILEAKEKKKANKPGTKLNSCRGSKLLLAIAQECVWGPRQCELMMIKMLEIVCVWVEFVVWWGVGSGNKKRSTEARPRDLSGCEDWWEFIATCTSCGYEGRFSN